MLIFVYTLQNGAGVDLNHQKKAWNSSLSFSKQLADLIVKAGPVHGYPWLVGLQDVLHSHGGHVDHNKADMPEKTRVLKQCSGSGYGTGSAGFWASRIRLRIH